MKITLRHFYVFPDSPGQPAIATLLSANAWDYVRTMDPADSFHMPADRGNWIRICEESTTARACGAAIVARLDRRKITTVLSAGVGRACVEYHLKSLRPDMRLICTEFGSQVLERLRTVFLECDEIRPFNFLQDSWPTLGAHGMVLLHRVDTELDDAEWRRVFAGLAAGGIDDVLLVATGFLDLKSMALELWRRVRTIISKKPLTHAGYIRTKDRMKELWKSGYYVEHEDLYGGLTGFWLRRT